ncbi:Intein C-terminal splicing region [Orpheovirus IHUMI-LCC2]|uniref:Intein C-terminal splicing region n=1 Tax=Orpheovirus IHUMI-LCC2 TaxID=2023057 RepID=A0A2I2L5W9_9VIRU|nr:Intein C-terminal splicing region [Orpheovirus IHUMI-LCC2]SNW62927.1 Intein C-terminal splicing region [Orpheovirus IHUMI-LCC2]
MEYIYSTTISYGSRPTPTPITLPDHLYVPSLNQKYSDYTLEFTNTVSKLEKEISSYTSSLSSLPLDSPDYNVLHNKLQEATKELNSLQSSKAFSTAVSSCLPENDKLNGTNFTEYYSHEYKVYNLTVKVNAVVNGFFKIIKHECLPFCDELYSRQHLTNLLYSVLAP